MSQIGLGTKIEINDGASSAFVAVAGLVNIKPPSEEVGSTDSKRLDLTARTITSIQTLQMPGDFTYQYEMSPAEYARHEALRRDASTYKALAKSFKITTFDDTTPTVKTVPGFVTKNEQDTIEADGIMMVNVTVKVTGPAS